MSDTTTGKTCFYCNHPGPYLGMPEDEEVNLCACCSWVDGHEKRSECFEHVKRERDEARAEASRIEGRAVEFSRSAEKAEAALERVEKHLARPLTWAESMQRMPNGQPFPRMEDPETILALIRNETDTKETP